MNFSQYCRMVAKEADKAHAVKTPPMPQTSKEKQESFRARNAMLGLTEVRNIYLPPALHPELKATAKRMLSKHEKTKGAK